MESLCICCGAELTGRNAFSLPVLDAACAACVAEVQRLLERRRPRPGQRSRRIVRCSRRRTGPRTQTRIAVESLPQGPIAGSGGGVERT